MTKIDSDSTVKQPLTTINLRFVWSVLCVILIVRMFYAWMVQLVPDEAWYWVWSRHLSTGYFDHPPMIAYLIRIGTRAVGSTELGVRLCGVVLSIGATILIVLLARRLLRDDRGAAWVGIMWIVSPLLTLTGLVATPDMPAIFFSACGLACALLVADGDDRGDRPSSALWLTFGLCSGLALLSKYTSVLLPAAVALAILFSRSGRVHFRRPWIYLSGGVALLVFSPVIWWNRQHHWASFLFQLRHGTVVATQGRPATPLGGAGRAVVDLAAYIGGQALVWTPIFFAIAILTLVEFWRRYRRIGQVDRVLLWTGTLPLVFFAVMYLKAHGGEVNWPGFAYVPLSILIGRWLSESESELRRGWVRGGCQLALGFTVALLLIGLPPVTRSILRLPFRIPHSVKDLVGNREEARLLDQQARQFQATVVCNHYQEAAEASFYMPGQPDVWCDGVGARPTGFDYFDHPPDFAHIPRVLWVGGHSDLFCAKNHYQKVWPKPKQWIEVYSPKNTRTLTTELLDRDGR